jgi:hypothetical protein
MFTYTFLFVASLVVAVVILWFRKMITDTSKPYKAAGKAASRNTKPNATLKPWGW